LQIDQLKTAPEDIGTSHDLVSLKFALQAICAEFGIINRLDVLHAMQGGEHQPLCYLQMGNFLHEQQILRYLEIARIPVDLIIDLPPEATALRQRSIQSADGLALASG